MTFRLLQLNILSALRKLNIRYQDCSYTVVSFNDPVKLLEILAKAGLICAPPLVFPVTADVIKEAIHFLNKNGCHWHEIETGATHLLNGYLYIFFPAGTTS